MSSSLAILIVDNSAYLRKLMQKSLKSHGYDNIIEAIDGKNALDALMEHKIDLILSSLNLAKVNGLELIKALKDHSGLKHIPFIAVTSDTSNEIFKETMKNGAAGYIIKPYTPTDLANKIESII
ncbi:MAG: response regulator [Desulfobacterales bacterium]|nr:response regulator [Desulfobacterales bacterium]MCP4159137.1 response regulator [Deltaproteobacteria bacterium]